MNSEIQKTLTVEKAITAADIALKEGMAPEEVVTFFNRLTRNIKPAQWLDEEKPNKEFWNAFAKETPIHESELEEEGKSIMQGEKHITLTVDQLPTQGNHYTFEDVSFRKLREVVNKLSKTIFPVSEEEYKEVRNQLATAFYDGLSKLAEGRQPDQVLNDFIEQLTPSIHESIKTGKAVDSVEFVSFYLQRVYGIETHNKRIVQELYELWVREKQRQFNDAPELDPDVLHKYMHGMQEKVESIDTKALQEQIYGQPEKHISEISRREFEAIKRKESVKEVKMPKVLYYFGTTLDEYGHYMFRLGKDEREREFGRLNSFERGELPKALTDLVHKFQEVREPQGTVSYRSIKAGGVRYSICGIIGSPKDERHGTCSVFFTPEPVEVEDWKSILKQNAVCEKIIAQMAQRFTIKF